MDTTDVSVHFDDQSSLPRKERAHHDMKVVSTSRQTRRVLPFCSPDKDRPPRRSLSKVMVPLSPLRALSESPSFYHCSVRTDMFTRIRGSHGCAFLLHYFIYDHWKERKEKHVENVTQNVKHNLGEMVFIIEDLHSLNRRSR